VGIRFHGVTRGSVHDSQFENVTFWKGYEFIGLLHDTCTSKSAKITTTTNSLKISDFAISFLFDKCLYTVYVYLFYRWLYVCLAIAVCLVTAGLLIFFMFPRDVKLSSNVKLLLPHNLTIDKKNMFVNFFIVVSCWMIIWNVEDNIWGLQ
jgi:hypothetical protein